jgi:hypothetical protein
MSSHASNLLLDIISFNVNSHHCFAFRNTATLARSLPADEN